MPGIARPLPACLQPAAAGRRERSRLTGSGSPLTGRLTLGQLTHPVTSPERPAGRL